MKTGLKEWDSSHPFSPHVTAWINRLRKEYYCDLSPLLEIPCNCVAWDSTNRMHRFWLCERAKLVHLLAFPRVFGQGRKR